MDEIRGPGNGSDLDGDFDVDAMVDEAMTEGKAGEAGAEGTGDSGEKAVLAVSG